MSRIKRAPALVISMLALVAALVVPAVAQVAITALTKKEKKQVKNISKNQANLEIDRRAPGLSVASANTAGNADQLDGQDAADFAGADELHASGRVVINDPTPGDAVAQTSTLITAGAFSAEGVCFDDHPLGTDLADVTLRGPTGSSFSGTRSTGLDVNAANVSALSVALAEATEVRSLHVTGVAPNGQAVSISVSAETGDPAGDCIFGATAIGP
jgi:hypothetical protein